MSFTARALLAARQSGPEGQGPPPLSVVEAMFPAGPEAGVADNVRTIVGVAVFCIVLSTASVGLRFFYRKRNKLQWLQDDWWILFAWLFTVADAACYLAALKYGFGHHLLMLVATGVDIVSFFKIAYATFILYAFAVTGVKISVLLFYQRIFPNSFKVWSWVLGGFSLVWFLISVFVSAFQCAPVARAWDLSVQGTCLPYLDIFIGTQVANILLDTAILCLPISAIMGLQMTRANKINVAATFLLGGLSIIFAVVRLAILVNDMHQTDITYDTATANWSVVEPAFEIFCACLPCITPVTRAGRWISQSITSLSSLRSKGSSGSYNKKQNSGLSSQGFNQMTDDKTTGVSVSIYRGGQPGLNTRVDEFEQTSEPRSYYDDRV